MKLSGRDLLLLGVGLAAGLAGAALMPPRSVRVEETAIVSPTNQGAVPLLAAAAPSAKPSARLAEPSHDSDSARAVAEVTGIVTGSRDARIKERVDVLRARLSLTDAQAAAAGALLEDLAPSAEELAMMTAGKGEDAEVARWHWAGESRSRAEQFAEKFGSSLSDQQKAEWGKFLHERKSDLVEAATNQELARLQSRLTLTTEQKDRVFAALSKEMAAELDGPVEVGLSRDMAEARRITLAQELSGVLTKEQLDLLQSLPDATSAPPAAPLFDFAELDPR